MRNTWMRGWGYRYRYMSVCRRHINAKWGAGLTVDVASAQHQLCSRAAGASMVHGRHIDKNSKITWRAVHHRCVTQQSRIASKKKRKAGAQNTSSWCCVGVALAAPTRLRCVTQQSRIMGAPHALQAHHAAKPHRLGASLYYKSVTVTCAIRVSPMHLRRVASKSIIYFETCCTDGVDHGQYCWQREEHAAVAGCCRGHAPVCNDTGTSEKKDTGTQEHSFYWQRCALSINWFLEIHWTWLCRLCLLFFIRNLVKRFKESKNEMQN